MDFSMARKIDVFCYLRNRVFAKNIFLKFYPYQNTCTQISKKAAITGAGSLHFNTGKIGRSKAEGYLRMDDDAELRVNGFFNLFYGCDIAVYQGGKLTLGSGFINAGGQIRCGNSIKIGDGVAIGRNFFVQDCDFHTIKCKDGKKLESSKPVVIGNHVWIGTNVMILKGVTIGDGAVIGAGAIITKDIPPNAVVVGNTNRIIMEDIRWT